MGTVKCLFTQQATNTKHLKLFQKKMKIIDQPFDVLREGAVTPEASLMLFANINHPKQAEYIFNNPA